MTTKHTPGPYYFKDGMIVSEDTGETLAILPYHGDEPEQIATGILLAAAPELLEAATFAIRMLLQSEGHRIQDDYTERTINDLHRAILKAEGGAE